MKVGYARVSTEEQNLDIQIKSLKHAGCKRIYEEKESGVARDRPELKRMLDSLRPDDVLIVWRLDRLARSTKLLLEIVDQLNEATISFQSLSENWADTTSPAGKLVMTVLSGMAEFERSLIRERTGAGRRAAQERGVKFGRPRKLSREQMKLALRLLKQGKSVDYIAHVFGVHKTTVYRLIESPPA